MKKEGILVLVILMLVVSVSLAAFASAESNETPLTNETGLNETEIEPVNNTGTSNLTEINNITEADNQTGTEQGDDNQTGTEQVNREMTDMPDPGITPDSALYEIDVLLDNAKAALTPTPLGKAKARLEIVQERAAEMEEMAAQNKAEEARRAELEVQKQMQKFDTSIRKVKKKDAQELQAQIQANAEKLERLKQKLRDSGSELADAIADALELLETSDEVIANIPDDFDPEATFILGSGPMGPATFDELIAQCIKWGEPPEDCEKIEGMCEEMGATTVNECLKMVAEGFMTAELKAYPLGEGPKDPHGCSGSYTSYLTKTKWCCNDSDRKYSPEWVEIRKSETRGMEEILNYYYRKGTVEYKIINIETGEIEEGTETDSCNGNILTEWLCPRVLDRKTRNERYSEEYECPNGCEDGACIPEEPEEINKEEVEECTDSDGGGFYFIKGVAYGYPNPSADTMEYFTDECDGNTLTEYLILTDCRVTSIQHECEYGCRYGSCMHAYNVQ